MNVANLARALSKFVSPEILGDLLNCTLGPANDPEEWDDKLSMAECDLIQDFHEALCEFCPAAVDHATGRDKHGNT